MITAAAFCPQAPVVVPAVASGAAAELDPLRAATRTALAAVAGRPLVLLGGAPTSAFHLPLARGTLAGYGVSLEVSLGAGGCGGALELPPSLTVAAWLVRDALGPRTGAVGVSVGPDFAGSRAAADLLAFTESGDVALVVAGDGSARRARTAPGYVDERAIGFDAVVAAALATGDAAALAALDLRLGAELLAAGVPAWRLAGELLDGYEWTPRMHYAADPYGVAYFAASWVIAGEGASGDGAAGG